MFSTRSNDEFHMPAGLTSPDARHWRLIQMNLHAPWFMLTRAVIDSQSEMEFVQTCLVSWERDLMDLLASVDPSSLRGLVCMAPGWKSPTGNWTSHEVHEAWLARTVGGERYLELRDVDGQVLDVGLPSDSTALKLERTLLFKLKPRWRVVQPSAAATGRRRGKS